MTTIAVDTVREDDVPEAGTVQAPLLPQVLNCFAEVIAAIDSEASLDSVLHLVARQVCRLVDCSRCAVYLKHSDTGLYRGQVTEPAVKGGDERIGRLVCGTAAD